MNNEGLVFVVVAVGVVALIGVLYFVIAAHRREVRAREQELARIRARLAATEDSNGG